jgi:hypothetical protein
MRSISSTQKNVAEQNTTKALAPTGILRSPSRRSGGEAFIILLNAVFSATLAAHMDAGGFIF